MTTPYRPAPRITLLGDGFADEVAPARFPKHVLRFRNQRWAERVGLGDLDERAWEAHFARFLPLPENLEKPLALRYHGHQFGTYNPFIGDGRGFLFAELEDDAGRLLDLATKGSGTTPWSRSGDGRLTLKGGVREVLATEMLEALGVNTSKSWSLFETGEALMRGDEPSPTRSAVLVRLGHSHIRFGTFQRLAHERDAARMERLLAYSIEQYFPELLGASPRVPAFLSAVTRKSALLCASWMAAGFVHGVLNSDNMTITGESFDYGPYRFLPTYDLEFVAAYFDHEGLYAYGKQPRAVFANLTRLAGALRLIAPQMALAEALTDFEPVLQDEFEKRVLAKLGIKARGDTDAALVGATCELLESSGVGYERFFFETFGGLSPRARTLDDAAEEHSASANAVRHLLAQYEPLHDALPPYFERDAPCTLLIDELEAIWSAIAERDDWAPFEAKIRDIRAMG